MSEKELKLDHEEPLDEKTNKGNDQQGSSSTDPAGNESDDSLSTDESESWQHSDEMKEAYRRAEAMMDEGIRPADIIRKMFSYVRVAGLDDLCDDTAIRLLSDLLDRSPIRTKLPQYNTLADAVELFRTKKRILVLTGAGVSVSCGIPDFRSKDGIYARLHSEFPSLPDPTAMFDIRFFQSNPAPFYNFAKEIFPGQFIPSVSHRFIKQLEDESKLLRNYTQNIDTLEHQTGITRVVECHGSFSKCTCTKCRASFDGDEIKEEVMEQRIAYCKHCKGVIKPDIVFFGEDLGQGFHRKVTEDKNKVDLIVVIGSSLKVRPVSLIPFCVNKDVPQILINRETLPHYQPDIELLGNCDDIIREICFSLGGGFEAMVNEYDELVNPPQQDKPLSSMPARGKRRMIEISELIDGDNDEFVPEAKKKRDDTYVDEVMNAQENNEHTEKASSSENDKLTKNDVPKTDEQQEVEMDPDQIAEERLRAIRKKREEERMARYVALDEVLPQMTCMQMSMHQTVFPGTEFQYDKEEKHICHRRKYEPPVYIDSSDDDDSSDDSRPGTPAISRTTSADNIMFSELGRLNEPNRRQSCHYDFEFDLSEFITPQDFQDFVHNLFSRE